MRPVKFDYFFVVLTGLMTLMIIVETKPPAERGNVKIVQLCGFRSVEDQAHIFGFNRIVGGKEAQKGEFKWQVSIRFRHGSGNDHICGGSVIGLSWVLTAAHCVAEFIPSNLEVVAGDYNLTGNDGTEQTRYPDMFIKHEEYSPLTQANDISLVRTTQPFDFGTLNVAPTCLPNPFEQYSGDCVVTGWGKDSESGSNSDILRKVWVPIINDTQCKENMKQISFHQNLIDRMICAGYDLGGKDACQGDSGGPMVCPGPGNLPILVGIVSWGIGCARKKIPGIYTEVSYYVNWINQKIAQNLPISTNKEQLTDQTVPANNQHSQRVVFGQRPPGQNIKIGPPQSQQEIWGIFSTPGGNKFPHSPPREKSGSSEATSHESAENRSSEEK